MKQRIITILAIFVAHTATAQVDISLREAFEMMCDNNPTLKASERAISAAEYERRATRGMYLPTIDLSANYTLLQRDIAIDLGGNKGVMTESINNLINNGVNSGILSPDIAEIIADGLSPIISQPWGYTLQKRSLGTISANITMPIYAGGRIRAANSLSDIELQKSGYQYLAIKNAMLSELIRCYYGVAVQSEVVVVRREVVRGVTQHLNDAIALEEEGIIAHSTLLYIRYRLSEAERELTSAELDLRIAKQALQRLIGIEKDVNITEKLFIVNNIYTIDYYIDNSYYMNPIISIAKLDKELSSVGSKVARAEFLPEIAIVGSGILGSYQLSDIMPRWAVGVGVNLKLFDGLSSQNRYMSTRIAERVADDLLKSTIDDITLLIEKEFYKVAELEQNITSCKTSIAYAESYLNSTYEGFKEGVNTSSELIDAEIEVAAARLEYIDAAYQYCMALARLYEASGIGYNFINIALSGEALDI